MAFSVVIFSLISFIDKFVNYDRQSPLIGTPAKPQISAYDRHFISAMNNVSETVPENQPVVITWDSAQAAYFIRGHPIIFPWGINSEQSLSNYMTQKKLTYLLVFENHSLEEALQPLFSSNGLKDLSRNFPEVSTYVTDDFKIHLYEHKPFEMNNQTHMINVNKQLGTLHHPLMKIISRTSSSTNLVLRAIENGSSIPVFRLEGNSGKEATGFELQAVNYKGQNISFTLGTVSKSSGNLDNKNIQISFTFYLEGHKYYPLLTLVDGQSSISGWRDAHFYQTIKPHSSNVINLDRLLPQDNYTFKKILIVVQKETNVNTIEFKIGW